MYAVCFRSEMLHLQKKARPSPEQLLANQPPTPRAHCKMGSRTENQLSLLTKQTHSPKSQPTNLTITHKTAQTTQSNYKKFLSIKRIQVSDKTVTAVN